MSRIGSGRIPLDKGDAVSWEECKRVPEIDKLKAELTRLKELNREMKEAILKHCDECKKYKGIYLINQGKCPFDNCIFYNLVKAEGEDGE